MDKFKKQYGPKGEEKEDPVNTKEKENKEKTEKGEKEDEKERENDKDQEKKKKGLFKTLSEGTGKWFENTFGKKKPHNSVQCTQGNHCTCPAHKAEGDEGREEGEREMGGNRVKEDFTAFTLPRKQKRKTDTAPPLTSSTSLTSLTSIANFNPEPNAKTEATPQSHSTPTKLEALFNVPHDPNGVRTYSHTYSGVPSLRSGFNQGPKSNNGRKFGCSSNSAENLDAEDGERASCPNCSNLPYTSYSPSPCTCSPPSSSPPAPSHTLKDLFRAGETTPKPTPAELLLASLSQPENNQNSLPSNPSGSPSINPSSSSSSPRTGTQNANNGAATGAAGNPPTNLSTLEELSNSLSLSALENLSEKSLASLYDLQSPHLPSSYSSLSLCLSSVLREFGIKEELNKKGLRRSKKEPTKGANPNSQFQMEDAHTFVIENNYALFAVFDGHSGNEVSFLLKEIFQKEFMIQAYKLSVAQTSSCTEQSMEDHSMSPTPRSTSTSNLAFASTDLRNLFLSAFAAVDSKLKTYQYQGSTATVAFLWKVDDDRFLQVANLGDSRAFLCREGKALMMTEDHKLANPSEQKRLKEMGIELNDQQTRLSGLSVTRAFGDYFAKEVESGIISEPYVSEPIKLTPTDQYLVLASDGLWDVMSGQKTFDIIQKYPTASAQEMSDILMKTCLQSPLCQDNTTVIVVCL